ncbi:MAG TPA: 1-acyl-sn-glycerol-3-phosphate acyltransferase [Candidatus Elarobacter sp.]
MAGPRLIAAWSLRRYAAHVDVAGLEHVPREGGVLIVARHYHHLLDGAVAHAHLPRPLHIVVALDWTTTARERRWMERACRWAGYPVILRPATTGSAGGYDAIEVRRYLRSGLRDAAALLRAGRVVLVFPEGYPVVDPTATAATPRDRDADGMLPFAEGFRTIARLAGTAPAIVPLGFRYERDGARWRIAARFGPHLRDDVPAAEVERTVRALSSARIA